MSKWIRRGDRVVVIAGNSKGQSGEVVACSKERVILQGVNLRKKHAKPTQQSQRGRIVEIEAPIHRSNVAFCDAEGNRYKVRVREKADGSKDLVFQRKGEEVVHRKIREAAKG